MVYYYRLNYPAVDKVVQMSSICIYDSEMGHSA